VTVLFLAAAVACAAFALSLWDVGSRSPIGMLRAATAAFAQRTALLAGFLRLLAGAGYAVLAIVLIRFAMPPEALDLLPAFVVGAFLVGLGVEALVGDRFRSLLGIGRPPTEGSGS